MRRLRTTVVAGGVRYPAGTPATPELLELIAEKHWGGDAPEQVTVDIDVTQTAEYAALRDQANDALAAAKATIDDLQAKLAAATARADAAEVKVAELQAAVTTPAPGPEPAPEPKPRTRQRRTPGTQDEG